MQLGGQAIPPVSDDQQAIPAVSDDQPDPDEITVTKKEDLRDLHKLIVRQQEPWINDMQRFKSPKVTYIQGRFFLVLLFFPLYKMVFDRPFVRGRGESRGHHRLFDLWCYCSSLYIKWCLTDLS